MSASQTRRQQPLSISLRPEVREKLDEFRKAGGQVNVSAVCGEAILAELDRQAVGDSFIERLRGELTERRGREWSAGRQEGRQWATGKASWLEVTLYATRFTPADVAVLGVDNSRGFREDLQFAGRFEAPEEDYSNQGSGAPYYRADRVYPDGRMEERWEGDPWRCERFWRGWITGVREIYDVASKSLPSVVDQLPPELSREAAPPPMPYRESSEIREVDPDDIPF